MSFVRRFYPGDTLNDVQTLAPSLTTGNSQIDSAFRIAMGDIMGNIVPFQDGILEQELPVLLAGLDYDTPWTRDAAINTWNGAGLLFPQVMRNTLLSVLRTESDTVAIDGQYWDAIIWTQGAWSLYLFTGDHAFLRLAFTAVRYSLAYFEATEFDANLNLFRGPACYGDGVAAYPDIYAHTNGSSSILVWPRVNPEQRARPGYGLPMHALSTNCLYYRSYLLLAEMARELGEPIDASWQAKALVLKQAINKYFWNESRGCYAYLVDPFGGSDHQEGLGHCFALLFEVADQHQAAAIFQKQHITAHGIPCLWPTFSRYETEDGLSFGRHSGTIWPHIQGFWSEACARYRQRDLFMQELYSLAEKISRDSQCAEIYHPLTGEIYGGVQEGQPTWKSCSRQSWSATGFLRMIVMGMFGMNITPQGMTFAPLLPEGIQTIKLCNLPYRQMVLDIEVIRSAERMGDFTINGKPTSASLLAATERGRQQIVIRVAA